MKTTHNACATIALLNIIMNITSVDIGHQLRSFKESTKALPTPLRGLRISTDRFIRFAHNSFTRRMDHLNCDLALDNEASVANKKGKKKHATKKGRAQARKDRKSKTDYAFHFIAYVPVGDAVWELDGLRTHPRELGRLDRLGRIYILTNWLNRLDTAVKRLDRGRPTTHRSANVAV